MAYSNCGNCPGSCASPYGSGYARRSNNACLRNNCAALNAVPQCTRHRNYPFYTGECPDICCGNRPSCPDFCDSCCHFGDNCCCGGGTCDHCGRCGNHMCAGGDPCAECCEHTGNTCGCRRRPVYGMFSAGAPLTVTAGAALPLTASTVSCNDFSVTGGTVTINRCGMYLATYTVNNPSGTTVDTDIVMNVNGVSQPGSLISIAAAGSYTGQTLFRANAGTTLSLISSAAFSITEAVGQNLVTLTITRID